MLALSSCQCGQGRRTNDRPKLDLSGYGIRRTEQHFEFSSVSRELVKKFSRRTELIEQRARDKYKVLEAEARALIRSTNMAFDDAFAHVIAEIGGDWDKWKSNLGARNRENKARRSTKPGKSWLHIGRVR